MFLTTVLVFHIAAAIITWPAGMAGLLSRKGSKWHRLTGNVFVASMLSMSASGACVALIKGQMLNINVGVLTFYLVATAWVAIKRKPQAPGLFERAAFFVALADGVAGLLFGWQAAHRIGIFNDGESASPYFVFGSVALLASVFDLNALFRGGVVGAHRIARHLWRMCFALLIDTASLFLGKQQHFPEAMRRAHLLHLPILTIPVIVVAGLMIYWLVRVLATGAYRKRRVSSQSDVYAPKTDLLLSPAATPHSKESFSVFDQSSAGLHVGRRFDAKHS